MSDENDSDESEGETQYGGRDDEGVDAVEQTERRTGDEDESGTDGNSDPDADSDSDADEEEWEETEHENPDDRE